MVGNEKKKMHNMRKARGEFKKSCTFESSKFVCLPSLDPNFTATVVQTI